MKLQALISFLTLSLLFSCHGQSLESFNNKNYIEKKKGFDNKLITHFPKKLNIPSDLISSKNVTKNDIGLMLYEYDMPVPKLDSIVNKIDAKYIAKYNSADLCLLIVNRFETMDTYENRKDVEIKDSTKINQECYKNLYPIPNFIDYKYPKKDYDLKLDNSFEIYVLEAKSGIYYKEYDLIPNSQMPENWRNGYSRGIAVSTEKKVIIYWAIIW